MERKGPQWAMLLILPLLATLMACRNPVAPPMSADAGSPPAGVVSLKFWPVAPVVVDLLAAGGLPPLRSVAPTRAFLAVTRVHVRLSGTIGSVQWDEYLEPAILCFDQGGLVGVVPQVTSRSVPAGSYTAAVDIYNTASDPYNAVSSGITAEAFSVAAGASTEVLVRCLPTNPVAVAKGVASDPLELAVPWQLVSSDPLELVPGSEQWLSVALTGGFDTQVTVTPAPGSEWSGGVFVFDPYGGPVTGGESAGEDAAASANFIPQYTGTYFIGVLGGTGPFTVLVEDTAIEPPAAAFTVSPEAALPSAWKCCSTARRAAIPSPIH